jgi:hypothetical protein
MAPVTIAMAMFIVGLSCWFRPTSPDAVVNLVTALLTAALVGGADALLIIWLWRAWRRFRHDA